MEWFDQFVHTTVKNWVEDGKARSLHINEYIEFLIDEEFTNYQIGNEAESFIKAKLDSKGYYAKLSPASRTPADVWAFKTNDLYSHLMLIQVKSTLKSDLPKSLSNDDISLFEQFASFVVNELQRLSANHTIANKPCIISIGYSGVRLSDPIEVSSSKGFKMWYTPTLEPNLKNINIEVRSAHKL